MAAKDGCALEAKGGKDRSTTVQIDVELGGHYEDFPMTHTYLRFHGTRTWSSTAIA